MGGPVAQRRCDAKKVNLAAIQIDLQDPARQPNCKLRASVASIDHVPLTRGLVLAATDHVRRMETRVQCPAQVAQWTSS